MSDKPEKIYAYPGSLIYSLKPADLTVEYIRADLAKPSEWISVDDRLPEESLLNWVLVGRDESGGCSSVMQAMFRDGEFEVISALRGNFTVFVNPTHWQPLPSPPTRETP